MGIAIAAAALALRCGGSHPPPSPQTLPEPGATPVPGPTATPAAPAIIAEGRSVTYDMKPNRDDPTAVGTSQVADAIIEQLQATTATPA
jgi:hypothetical protein